MICALQTEEDRSSKVFAQNDFSTLNGKYGLSSERGACFKELMPARFKNHSSNYESKELNLGSV